VGEGLSLALLLGVAGELARRRTAGEWRRDQTLGEGGVLRVSGIRESGRCGWPAEGADDGGGPEEEAQGTRDAGRSPEASRKAASGGAGGGR
jgi:hypothetical protein